MSEIGLFLSGIPIRLFCLNRWKDYSHKNVFPTWWNVDLPYELTNGRRYVESTFVRPSAHLPVRSPASPPLSDLVSETKSFMGFLWNSVRKAGYKKSNKHEFHENRHGDSHTQGCKCVSTPTFHISYYMSEIWHEISARNVVDLLSVVKIGAFKAIFYSIFRLVSG